MLFILSPKSSIFQKSVTFYRKSPNMIYFHSFPEGDEKKKKKNVEFKLSSLILTTDTEAHEFLWR